MSPPVLVGRQPEELQRGDFAEKIFVRQPPGRDISQPVSGRRPRGPLLLLLHGVPLSSITVRACRTIAK